MTKKEKFVKLFEDLINKDDLSQFVAVEIETRGSNKNEIIINPRDNFEAKLEYYKNSYNDDLVLNTYDGIKIVSACAVFSDVRALYSIAAALKDNRF